MLSRRTTGFLVAISLLGIVSTGLAANKIFQAGIDPTTGKPLDSQTPKPGFPVIRRGEPQAEDAQEPEAAVANPSQRGSMTVLPPSESPFKKGPNPAAKVVNGFQKFGRSVFGRMLPGDNPVEDEYLPPASVRTINPRYQLQPAAEPRAGSILNRTISQAQANAKKAATATDSKQKVAVAKPSEKKEQPSTGIAKTTPRSVTKTSPATPQTAKASARSTQGDSVATASKPTVDKALSKVAAVNRAKAAPATPTAAVKASAETPAVKVASTEKPQSSASPAETSAAVSKPSLSGHAARGKGALAGLTQLTNPVKRSLNERLSSFRSSAFRSDESVADTAPAAGGTAAGSAPSAAPEESSPTVATQRIKIEQAPAMAPRPVAASPKYAESVDASEKASLQDLGDEAEPKPLAPAGETLVETPAPRVPVARAAAGPDGTAGGVLIAGRGPALSVQTLGPRRITVGKESVYEVCIQNSGEEAAEEVVVSIDLPASADVLGTQPSAGSTQSPPSHGEARPLLWHIDHLAASSQQRLQLRIVPRESKPFDLAVRWDYRAAVSQAMIEVQEPRLELGLDGPREVLYGKNEMYRLKLTNTGNGAAENVILSLLPVGSGNQPVSQNLGILAAGAEKVIEVELTARQVGDLEIRVQARGDGGAHAELAEKVLVRRANLVVEVAGPDVQYVGTSAAYIVRVVNSGTATAQNVSLVANLPAGATYTEGIDGGRLEANGTKIAWTLPTLMAGEQREFHVKCKLGLPGANRLEVVSAAEDDLTASGVAVTQVESIADLVLDVHDPDGPVAVGSEAVYELAIRNRGTKNAEDVQVKVFFSHGIEPSRVDGGQHRIGPGQVIFNPVSTLPAGGELKLRVFARAETPGNHIFRAEVHSQPQGTRLVSEETTHYYLDGPATASQSNSAVPLPPRTEARPLDDAAPGQLPTGFSTVTDAEPSAVR